MTEDDKGSVRRDHDGPARYEAGDSDPRRAPERHDPDRRRLDDDDHRPRDHDRPDHDRRDHELHEPSRPIHPARPHNDRDRDRPEERYHARDHDAHEARDRRGDDDDRREHGRRDDDDEPRLTKIIERIWYFEDEGDEDRRHRRDGDDDGRGGRGSGRPGPGGHGPGRPGGGRPTRPPGVQTGRLDNGEPLTGGDLKHPLPPGVWVGPRAEMDLPYLFMRANAADVGARPIKNAPFWESPDIFILAGVTPSSAPAVPSALGQVAVAGQPNTLYAHVWNFGKAAASEVMVEFYWCNPSLGIDAGTVQLIAQTTMSLGAKGSGHAHAVVMCPEAWTPTFVNGGHECLLVRVWDNPSDLPGEPKFDACANRHVAQRNIHVIGGPAAAAKKTAMKTTKPLVPGAKTPALGQPLLISVGALYGAPARVAVERIAPHQVSWLQQHTGKRGVFPAMATPTGVPSLSPPAAKGGLPPAGGAASHQVTGDDQQVAFTTSDHAPAPGEAHCYRVSATQNGAVFGGYTVVILG